MRAVSVDVVKPEFSLDLRLDVEIGTSMPFRLTMEEAVNLQSELQRAILDAMNARLIAAEKRRGEL